MKKVFFLLGYVMKEKNINIKQIQKSTSLSRTTISKLINHYSNGIQFDTLALLCEVLDCTPGDLLVIHSVDLKFEILDKVVMELSSLNGIQTDFLEINLSCLFEFDQKEYECDFRVECQYSYSTTDTSADFDLQKYKPSIKFEHFLKQNQFPPYIVDYLQSRLKDHIIKEIKTILLG